MSQVVWDAPLRGYWSVIEDGGAPKKWWTVSWLANTPTGTGFEVWVRASDDRLALSTEQFVQAASGVQVQGVRGRFLEVRTALTRSACPPAQDPYLEWLKICSFTKTLTVLAPPTDQRAREGEDAAFEVVALGTEPLTYQWFFKGAPVGANSPVLSLAAVDCLDQDGPYTVHITDAAEDAVDAGPAFLEVFRDSNLIPAIGTEGIALVYPAEITVDTHNTITSVEVVLNGFTHGRPDDLDILLVSPGQNGRKIMLMSDAGGTTGVGNLTLTFSSQSGSQPPDEQALTTGIYAPVNHGEVETAFPAATGGKPNPPAGPYNDTLINLIGTDPSGVWRLYIVDDLGQRSGHITSWCLNLGLSQ